MHLTPPPIGLPVENLGNTGWPETRVTGLPCKPRKKFDDIRYSLLDGIYTDGRRDRWTTADSKYIYRTYA